MNPISSSRRPVREILIKIVEGRPLEQRDTSAGPVLYWGGREFSALRDFETRDRLLRQSFPRFVERLRRVSTDAVGPNRWTSESLDLFLRLILFNPEDEPMALIAALETHSEVAYARPVIPLSTKPPSTVGDLEVNEGFLEDSLHQGIDAYYAWGVTTAAGATTDGRGTGLRVAICDQGYCSTHPNLPAVMSYGTMPTASALLEHGTKVLGVLGSPKTGGEGTIGICPGASFVFSVIDADTGVDVKAALDTVLGTSGPTLLQAGDVLLLEAQLAVSYEGWASPGGPNLIPVEANVDVLNLFVRAASVLGITVVEAAGDDGFELVPVKTSTGVVLWDPGSDDSLAIMVGSGSSTDHSRIPGDNYGARVDCQGWGEDVYAPYCPDLYDVDFNGTSSASAIVAGLVACLQGAYNGADGAFLDPITIRDLVRDDALGSPQAGDRAKHIGPLPDLSKILCSLGICPEIHLRPDFVEPPPTPYRHWPDPPHPAVAATSPDVLLRPDPLFDPDRAFGAGTWARDFDSTPVSADANYTYVRMTNTGLGPDSGVARAWWSHPSPFLHPRWWRPCSDEDAPVPLLAPRDVGVACVPWSARPRPGFASLIAAVISDRAPAPLPNVEMSTSEFLAFVKEHDHVRFRSVFVSPWRGAPVAFPCFVRGVPEGSASFALQLRSNLPAAAKVTIVTDHPACFPAAPSGLVYKGNGSDASIEAVLAANDEVLAVLTVELAPDTRAGRYLITVDQWMGHVTLGRVTFVVEVPSAPA